MECNWNQFLFFKLPFSNGFDCVLVIVYHFNKATHFIPCLKSMNAAELDALFIQQFLRLHGLPDKIVSNCGPSYVYSFWLAVQHALHIRSAPSTDYQLETDGQTERTNQTMETYLHHLFSYHQYDCADQMPVAEFRFNNPVSHSAIFII